MFDLYLFCIGNLNIYVQLSDEELETRIPREWKNAARANDNKRIKYLFTAYKKYIDIHSIIFENGDNPLQYAASNQNYKLCKLLIIFRINVCTRQLQLQCKFTLFTFTLVSYNF